VGGAACAVQASPSAASVSWATRTAARRRFFKFEAKD
jgi:hypothetical protein